MVPVRDEVMPVTVELAMVTNSLLVPARDEKKRKVPVKRKRISTAVYNMQDKKRFVGEQLPWCNSH